MNKFPIYQYSLNIHTFQKFIYNNSSLPPKCFWYEKLLTLPLPAGKQVPVGRTVAKIFFPYY